MPDNPEQGLSQLKARIEHQNNVYLLCKRECIDRPEGTTSTLRH